MNETPPDDPQVASQRPVDPDMAGADAAILRAAKRARLRAAANGTPVAIWQDGKVVWVKVSQKGELQLDQSRSAEAPPPR